MKTAIEQANPEKILDSRGTADDKFLVRPRQAVEHDYPTEAELKATLADRAKVRAKG